jgi:hypothetical protein
MQALKHAQRKNIKRAPGPGLSDAHSWEIRRVCSFALNIIRCLDVADSRLLVRDRLRVATLLVAPHRCRRIADNEFLKCRATALQWKRMPPDCVCPTYAGQHAKRPSERIAVGNAVPLFARCRRKAPGLIYGSYRAGATRLFNLKGYNSVPLEDPDLGAGRSVDQGSQSCDDRSARLLSQPK